MYALRSHIALLLLLCFTRTLLPEAWILALHPHTHTTEEPAHTPGFRHKGKALVSSKHQHCAVDHLYDVPLLLAAPVVVPTPRVRPVFGPLARTAVQTCAAQPVGIALLRGPPILG